MKIDFEQPEFGLNEEIFVIGGPDDYLKTIITAYQGLIFPIHTDKTLLESFATEARILDIITNDYFEEIRSGEGFCIPLKYITKCEEEAKKWSQWYPVIMSDEKWLEAIGNRNKKEGEKSFPPSLIFKALFVYIIYLLLLPSRLSFLSWLWQL